MDRAADRRDSRSSDAPQDEKSAGPSLLDAARQARLRQRKLARQKADDAPETDAGAEAKPEGETKAEGEGESEAEGDEAQEETLEGGEGEEQETASPDQALQVALKGQEGPLPHEEEMKKRFKGKPLKVRCFFGPEAQKACKMVGAKAFAVGNVIAFADDAPDANLVAHELEHVVQQGDAPEPSGPLEMTEEGDADEEEAEAKAKEDPEQAEADPSEAPAAGGEAAEPEKPEKEEKQAEGDAEPASAEDEAEEQKGKPAKLARFQAIQSPQGQLNVPLRQAPNAPGGTFVPITTRVVRMAEQPAPAPGQPHWVQVRVTTGDDMGMTGWVRSDELGEQPETEELTQGDAARLFGELAGASMPDSDTPIPFHFPPDGCWGRAQIMANLLTEKGYASEKVFAVSQKQQQGGPTRPGLNVQTEFAPDAAPGQEPSVQWWFHVAPIVKVRSPDGKVAQMVMDPSLAGGPIGVGAWTGMMSPEQFHEVPLAGVQALMQKNNGTLFNSPEAVNHPMTFEADRNTMRPDDAGKVGAGGPGTTSNTPASAAAELQEGMGAMQMYAQYLAPLHELAGGIRELLPRAPGSSAEVVQRVRDFASSPQQKMALAHFASSGHGTYSGNFPNLVADMRKKLTPDAMAEIDQLISEGKILQAETRNIASADGAAGDAIA